jgi:uncharacterized protein with von Willebrand factor type A (vWA) domain
MQEPKKQQFQAAAEDICLYNELAAKCKEVNLHHIDELASVLYSALQGDVEELPYASPVTYWQNRILPLILNAPVWSELVDELKSDPVNCAIAAINLVGLVTVEGYGPLSSLSTCEDSLSFNFKAAESEKSYAQELGLTASVVQLEKEIQEAQSQIDGFNKSLDSNTRLQREAELAVRCVLLKAKDELIPSNGRSMLPDFRNGSLAAQVNAASVFKNSECKMAIAALGWIQSSRGKKKKVSESRAISGITFGNDLNALLAEEYLKPKYQFGIEFVEGKLYQYKNGQSRGRAGDFFLLCDWSSSMNGTLSGETIYPGDGEISRAAWAKGIFLKLWEIAAEQDRRIHFVPFTGRVRDEYCHSVGKKDSQKVIEILNSRAGGGSTSWEAPLHWCIEELKKSRHCRTVSGGYKHSDVLYVTDADSYHASDAFTENVKQWKRQFNLSIDVILASSRDKEAKISKLRTSIADKVIDIANLSDEAAAKSAASLLLEY